MVYQGKGSNELRQVPARDNGDLGSPLGQAVTR